MITSARIDALRQHTAEISHPDYPDERLVACRNPLLAAERAPQTRRTVAATEALLAPVVTAVAEGWLHGTAAIGLKTGKLINRYKMPKHFHLAITDTSLSITRTSNASPRSRRWTASMCYAPVSAPSASTHPTWSPRTSNCPM